MGAKVMSGARAILGKFDPKTQTVVAVGIFNNVSYGNTYDAQPVYLLGRYSPDRIEYTAAEPVTITASGWRVYGYGPHKIGMPLLQDLNEAQDLQMAIFDRQEDAGAKPLARFTNVKCTSFSTTISARNLEEMTMTFVGIRVDDEGSENHEGARATSLDDIQPLT